MYLDFSAASGDQLDDSQIRGIGWVLGDTVLSTVAFIRLAMTLCIVGRAPNIALRDSLVVVYQQLHTYSYDLYATNVRAGQLMAGTTGERRDLKYEAGE